MGIGSDNGLATNRRQAITWTNADPVHRRIYEVFGGDELIHWGWDKMAAILQTRFSGTFSCIVIGFHIPGPLWRFSLSILAVNLNKLLNKQSGSQWFEMPWRPCHYNDSSFLTGCPEVWQHDYRRSGRNTGTNRVYDVLQLPHHRDNIRALWAGDIEVLRCRVALCPLLLTSVPAWISNRTHSKVWNEMYIYIPKLQRLHRWSLGMDKLFHPTLYDGCITYPFWD